MTTPTDLDLLDRLHREGDERPTMESLGAFEDAIWDAYPTLSAELRELRQTRTRDALDERDSARSELARLRGLVEWYATTERTAAVAFPRCRDALMDFDSGARVVEGRVER